MITRLRIDPTSPSPPSPPTSQAFNLNSPSSPMTSVTHAHSGTACVVPSGPSLTYVCHLTNKILRTFPGHVSSVACASLSPGSDKLVSVDTSGQMKQWELTSAAALAAGPAGSLLGSGPAAKRRGQAASLPRVSLAWDPTGSVYCACHPSSSEGSILAGTMYDGGGSPPAPFASFDVTRAEVEKALRRQGAPTTIDSWISDVGMREVTGAEFSADGERFMVKGLGGCFVILDAFSYGVVGVPVEHLQGAGGEEGPTVACFGRGAMEAVVVDGGGEKIHLYKNYMSSVSAVKEAGGDKVVGLEWIKGRDVFVTVGSTVALWQGGE